MVPLVRRETGHQPLNQPAFVYSGGRTDAEEGDFENVEGSCWKEQEREGQGRGERRIINIMFDGSLHVPQAHAEGVHTFILYPSDIQRRL